MQKRCEIAGQRLTWHVDTCGDLCAMEVRFILLVCIFTPLLVQAYAESFAIIQAAMQAAATAEDPELMWRLARAHLNRAGEKKGNKVGNSDFRYLHTSASLVLIVCRSGNVENAWPDCRQPSAPCSWRLNITPPTSGMRPC